MNDNVIKMRAVVWFYKSGSVEIEAAVNRGDVAGSNFVVRKFEGDDANWINPESMGVFRSELASFAQRFLTLGFDVEISSRISVNDMRKND